MPPDLTVLHGQLRHEPLAPREAAAVVALASCPRSGQRPHCRRPVAVGRRFGAHLGHATLAQPDVECPAQARPRIEHFPTLQQQTDGIPSPKDHPLIPAIHVDAGATQEAGSQEDHRARDVLGRPPGGPGAPGVPSWRAAARGCGPRRGSPTSGNVSVSGVAIRLGRREAPEALDRGRRARGPPRPSRQLEVLHRLGDELHVVGARDVSLRAVLEDANRRRWPVFIGRG